MSVCQLQADINSLVGLRLKWLGCGEMGRVRVVADATRLDPVWSDLIGCLDSDTLLCR